MVWFVRSDQNSPNFLFSFRVWSGLLESFDPPSVILMILRRIHLVGATLSKVFGILCNVASFSEDPLQLVESLSGEEGLRLDTINSAPHRRWNVWI